MSEYRVRSIRFSSIFASTMCSIAPGTTQQAEPIATSVTDDGGHFKFSDLEPGDYLVDAFAPAFVAAGADLFNLARGRSVTVGEGEAAKGVDVALTRGGVITGRVVDSNRQPANTRSLLERLRVSQAKVRHPIHHLGMLEAEQFSARR